MSGIVGIINLDGRPVNRDLLNRLTDFMGYRGPDAQEIWIDGHVGFGHTMLRTTTESLTERQPCSLDGKVWITADARVDGRADLIQTLEAERSSDLKNATDVELILHAYHAWGEECVKRLIGDFAFAIWDEHRQRLFCARDHFGVKPFYYAYVDGSLVFSNTLNCIRRHPAVSDELNDLAIGDFLLFGVNQDLATTAFADIRKLPGAHYLTCSTGAPRLSRYWELSIDREIRYKRTSDYVEHFNEYLRAAVSDRLRTQQVGILMSGGLDSTAVAAAARKLLSTKGNPFDLRAYTIVYDRLIPDQERYYSGLIAKALDIPIHYLAADNYRLYERWGQPELRTPEPDHNPQAAIYDDLFRLVATDSRAALTGQGSDFVFFSSKTSFVELLKSLRFGPWVTDAGRYILSNRQLPPLGIRASLKRRLGIVNLFARYPAWFNEAFAARVALAERWKELHRRRRAAIQAPSPEACLSLIGPLLSYCFERGYDPGATWFPVEFRHPFFDLRLMKYLLAIPPMPWYMNKALQRIGARGILPEAVRLRPKAPLPGDILLELLRQRGMEWVDRFEPTSEVARYVNRDAIPRVLGEQNRDEAWTNLRPLSLNYWLQNLREFSYNTQKEGYHEDGRAKIQQEAVSQPRTACVRRYQ